MSQRDLAGLVVDAMQRGDARAIADLLVAAPEKERRAIAGGVAREWEKVRWSPNARDPRPRAARAVAWAGTTTARKVASDWWTLGHADSEELYEVLAARGRSFVEVVVSNLLKGERTPSDWPLVRRAVRDGLIERPEDDRYATLMAAGVAWGEGAWEHAESVYLALLDDPDLLAEDVWLLFEVDCGSELANAGVWVRDPDRVGLQQSAERTNRWIHALKRLADEGRLDRDRLLDASLDAFMRDFRESSVGWYAQLHEALEPTAEERRARAGRYLALLASPSPAAMREALVGIKAVEEAVEPDALARAAATPLTQKQKNLAVETLRLLERAVSRHPDAASELFAAAVQGLGHERSDVQERALALLERTSGEMDVRAAVLAYTDVVSPLLRDRVVALAGLAEPEAEVLAAAPPAEAWPEPVRPSVTLEAVRTHRRQLEPVESVDELVELGASLVEGAGGGDDAERFLDGVSRFCAERPPELRRRAAGLVRRAEEQQAAVGGATGVGLIATLIRAWLDRKRPPRDSLSGTMLAIVERRVVEVAERALRGRSRPLLAFPTHAGGWIDPVVLARREQGTGRFRNRPDQGDRLQAHARAFPDAAAPVFRPEARYDRQHGQAVEQPWLAVRLERRAGGLEPALATAAERPGSRSRPADWWRGESLWAGMDALSARWCLTVLPTMPEIAYAAALDAAVDRIDDSVYFHPDVVLAHALEPSVPLVGLGWTAAGAGLLAKSPDLHRPAVDLVVQTVSDGRFDPDALGSGIAWLLDEGFGTISRLDRPLRDAARVSPLHGAQVVRLVASLLAHLETSPRNLHVPLEVALEQATLLETAIEPAESRAALERLAAKASASSKLGRAVRGLLAREPDSAALASLRGLAVRAAAGS